MPATKPLPNPLIREKARTIRKQIIKTLVNAASGHSAGALGMADVFAVLYFSILKHDPKNPDWSDRDRLILSNGHICPVLYATLAEAGYFPKEELLTLRNINSRLQGHPHFGSIAGIENSSGPLGQGLSIACGIAKSLQMDHKQNQVFCITSDGEQQEGQTWEAYMFAGNNNLANLCCLIDRNHIQIGGFTEDVMPVDPLVDKIRSFNWQVIEIDGHNIKQIIEACQSAKEEAKQPTAIICRTVPGKGVSFMENKPEWHGKPPSQAQADQAMKELDE